METRINRLAITLLIIVLMIINPLTASAQNGSPPPPPGEHSQTGNQPPGGGTPIGSGLLIMLALGAAYGGNKLRNIRKNKPAE
jgi:hypothetical protein